jgi:hypothetical protein
VGGFAFGGGGAGGGGGEDGAGDEGVIANRWSELIELLDKKNVVFLDGLTDAEIEEIEGKYGFRFPPDLRDFLQTALPAGHWFPNWRSGTESDLREGLSSPLSQVLLDVEGNDFWLPEWGVRPETTEERRIIVEKLVGEAPRLIPLNLITYLPDRPHESGNPVLSIHQADIVYVGFDLNDYLRAHFHLPDRKPWPENIREIEFWDVDRWQSIQW